MQLEQTADDGWRRLAAAEAADRERLAGAGREPMAPPPAAVAYVVEWQLGSQESPQRRYYASEGGASAAVLRIRDAALELGLQFFSPPSWRPEVLQ